MTHEALRKRAVQWLTNTQRCSVVLSEIVTSCSEVPDAVGWRNWFSMVVECKVSRSDYFAQKNKNHVLAGRGVGQHGYILCPKGMLTVEDLDGTGYGLMEIADEHGNIRVKLPPLLREPCREDEITMLVSALRRVRAREFLVIVPETDMPTGSRSKLRDEIMGIDRGSL